MSVERRRIRYFVACDQARQESNNKGFLIGTYSRALIVEGTFPAVLPSLSLVACIDVVQRVEDLDVEIVLPGLPPYRKTHKARAQSPLDTATIVFDIVPCVLPAPGRLELRVTFAGGGEERGDLEVVSREDYKSRDWAKPD